MGCMGHIARLSAFSQRQRAPDSPWGIMPAIEQNVSDLESSAPPATVEALQALLLDARRRHADAAQSHTLLRALIDHLPVMVYAKDLQGRFIMANDEVARVMGAKSAEEMVGKTDADFYPAYMAEAFNLDEMRVIRDGVSIINKDEPRQNSGAEMRWILTTKVPLRDEAGKIIGLVGVSKDITYRKRLERQRDQYITKLQDALANVRTLRGLLPICANCKQIRDDEGYWHRVEHYVQEHTHAEFSHGICPECAQKLYPQMANRLDDEQQRQH